MSPTATGDWKSSRSLDGAAQQDDEGYGITEYPEDGQRAHGQRVDGEVEQRTGRRDRKLVGSRRRVAGVEVFAQHASFRPVSSGHDDSH